MEKFKKPLVVITLSVLFLVLCEVSLARKEKKTEVQNQRSTYIVHASKFQMPESFDHPTAWFESTLKLVSDSAEMIYTYDKAIHGFSTRLTPEEARLLESQNGILKVLPDEIYKLQTTRTPEFLGLDKITAAKSTLAQSNIGGSDIIIGFIDTGIWPESKSFDDTGYGPIPSTWKGKCVGGANFTAANCNKKLIGARFYKNGWKASGLSARDDEGHGTHIASTAAGSPVQNVSLFGYAAGTARGMAPRARVAVYKVCWSNGCAVSDILAAIDQAIADNVNVLSLSLGSGPVPYYMDNFAIGAFSAMEHGIVVSCAAGNAGPYPSSVSHIAPWLMTVGASTLDRDFPAYISLGNGKNYSGVSIYSGNKLPDKPVVPLVYGKSASLHQGTELLSAICLQGWLSPQKVKGKIVVCDRGGGSNTVAEKSEAVKSAGGLAMVLANSQIEGEDLTAESFVLPELSVGEKAGKAIKEYLNSDPNPTATIVFQGTKIGIEPTPVVAGFSSRGPGLTSPFVLIKPDLIAPGVNILAAYTRNKAPSGVKSDERRVDFNIDSGTSMSCPHVSGIAALIKSAHPNWSPAAIRSALMTTAYSTYKNGSPFLDRATGNPATPFDFGAGHVDPVRALNPGLVYDLTADDYLNFLCLVNSTSVMIELIARRKFMCKGQKEDLNYPSFGVLFKHNVVNQVKQMRTLTNVGAAGTYKVSVPVNVPGVKITVEPEVLSFGINEKKSYTVTFTESGVRPQITHGFGRLEWSNGKNIVGSPIAVLF